MEEACARLARYIPEIERAYGDDTTTAWLLRVGPATETLTGIGTEVASLKELVATIGAAVADRLEQRR